MIFRNLFTSLFTAIFLLTMVGARAERIKVACVGNSITHGVGVRNLHKDSYPSVLGQLLGDGYEVRNFGYSSRTMLMKGDWPYMKEQMYQDALAYQPNIVTIALGTNDTKPENWKYGKDFQKDLETMIAAFKALPSHPAIYVCLPVPTTGNYGINNKVLVSGVIPAIKKAVAHQKVHLVDLYTPLRPHDDYFPDRVHPNEKGAVLIAQTLYKGLTGKSASDYVVQAFPGKKTQWHGFDRYDFQYNGKDAIVVAPKKAAKGNPWIWRPAFFDAFPSVDDALLKRGFHVAYYDLTHLYGSPNSVNLGTSFYYLLKDYYGLSSKVTVEGFSRGGFFAINWAAKNTDKVACLYLDAPVCDIFSWPSRKDAALWQGFLKEWGLTNEQATTFRGNAIDQVAALAKANIPIISVCGDNDHVVPFKENMAVVWKRYKELGGTRIELILKPGVDHHPHSLENPDRVVQFIVRHQPGATDKQHITVRGTLQNVYAKMQSKETVRVAFLGGSITEMSGWRTYIQQSLKQRFPDAKFDFVDAGVASTGSTPGAFRIVNDVLSKGKIDLLFVEAAVNDDTNGYDAVAQVRGMEGEVRHALKSNPQMDLVMLHFIYDPFIPILQSGRTPDVILNHERVANQYHVSSINLAQEIAERMAAGEFTWDEFGGTHPSPFGHTFYAAAINRLFDSCWKGQPQQTSTAAPLIAPLDSFSYDAGHFVDIKQAKCGKGWKVVADWTPQEKIETRQGFVNVPMLEAHQAGAKMSLNFKGKAIGIFCVAGPQAAVLEYSIDGAPYKSLNTYTQWSNYLYIPWLYMLEDTLKDKEHTLILRIAKENKKTGRYACQIRNFVVN